MSASHQSNASVLAPRILLVEDNAVVRDVVQMMLSSLGQRADVATDGACAVEAFRSTSYDLLLMDVFMPNLNGLEATRQIRNHSKSDTNPWIVALTANENASEIEECLVAGMNEILHKPVRLERLEQLLRRRTEKQRARSFEAERAAVSRDVILALCGGRPQQLQSICDAYLREARSVVSQLQAAAAVGDLEKIREKAHYLKGSSELVGAKRLTTICRQLQNSTASPRSVAPLLREMGTALVAAATAFERLSRESNGKSRDAG